MYTDFFGKVYSVGDGFCYEGRIKGENGSKFHFVIDCGSQAPKNRKQRVGQLSCKKDCDIRLEQISDEIINHDACIDLFVLTHLHSDHYNGMKSLFRTGIPDTIIMPYLYPEERLCLIVNNDSTGEEAEFLAMPYTRILDLARENNPNVKLFLVRGNKEDNDWTNRNNMSSDEPVVWGELHEDAGNILELEELNSSSVKVLRVNQKGIKIPDAVWNFKFFNLEIDQKNVDMLKKIVGNLTARNLYNNISSLKKQYKIIGKNLFNDFNNTSIVTYHSPIKGHNRCGTLISGDIDLNHNITDLILKHFEDEIDKIGLFSIPHHGSKKNWNKKLLDNGDLDGSVCFVSTHNYYANRITASMLSDLRCHNIDTLVVDENRFNEIEQYIGTSYWHQEIFILSDGKYKTIIV